LVIEKLGIYNIYITIFLKEGAYGALFYFVVIRCRMFADSRRSWKRGYEMEKEIPLILVAENEVTIAHFFVEFLSTYGGANVEVANNPSAAISMLQAKSFNFVICDGTGWQEVHRLLKEQMPGRYCVYTGNKSIVEALKKEEVYAFEKGYDPTLYDLTDWVLTKLQDEGFDCHPDNEVRKL
jgi:CheY-like chemotaxis protein